MVQYDPRADIVFRKIFGEHKHLCMSLLNSLLPLSDEQKIVSLEYLPSDVLPLSVNGKNSIVDVRCKDKDGRTFIVEMQMYWTEAFLMRTLLNASKAFASQADKGTGFKDLQPVYSLCLLNESMPKAKEYKDEYRHLFIICHENHKELTIDGMKFVFVELLKFHSLNKGHNKLMELWLSFLTMLQDNTDGIVPEYLTKDKNVAEAVEIVQDLKLTPEERAHYEKFWDEVSCERTLLSERFDNGVKEGLEKGEKIGLEKGEKIGLEKGEKIGLVKGEQIGLEKGRRKEKEEMARNLKAMGVDLTTIAKASGLSIEEIQNL
ncbi:MAG: Rpn family recombination-promoting nuclease/putative transposase [Bacteroidales bacterium]|nr:Rpn family recombination-promoting nuclease/putative transposase [Bacteroidales bacterium]